MRHFSEGKALFIAMAGAAVTLLGTFGLAAIIRLEQAKPIALTTSPVLGDVAMSVELAVAGRHLFLMNCAHCHGDDARGDEGPDLHDLHKSDSRIHQVITVGIKGEMPSFARKLNDADIRALTVYLRTLS